jgi:hypothetical protein
MQEFMSEEDGQNLLAAMKIYDDLTPMNMVSSEYAGGAISACQILNNSEQIPRMVEGEVADLLLESHYIEQGLKYGSFEGVDMKQHQTISDEEWVPELVEIDPSDKEIPWYKSDWAKELGQNIHTYTFTLSEVVDGNDLAPLDTEELYKDFDDNAIEVTYMSNSTVLTVGEKLESVVKRYVSKWKTTAIIFREPSLMTSTELIGCKLLASEAVGHLVPIFKNMVSKMRERDLNSVVEVDKVGAIISECYAILRKPLPPRRHTDLVEITKKMGSAKRAIEQITGILIPFKIVDFRRKLKPTQTQEEILYYHFSSYVEEDRLEEDTADY